MKSNRRVVISKGQIIKIKRSGRDIKIPSRDIKRSDRNIKPSGRNIKRSDYQNQKVGS